MMLQQQCYGNKSQASLTNWTVTCGHILCTQGKFLLVVVMRHGSVAKSQELEFLKCGVEVMLLLLEEILCAETV